MKALRPSANSSLEGSFFDVSQMSESDLTQDEINLVTGIDDLFYPKNRLDLSPAGLKKISIAPKGPGKRSGDTLLCLFDPAENRFYIYEGRA